MTQTWQRTTFVISDDPTRLQLDVIHGFLTRSYWAVGISLETVQRSILHSVPFGMYTDQGEQIGFARVISDRTTFAYLSDVFVLEAWRGQGLGTWLVECILAHPDLQGLRRWLLATLDAHDLYRKSGFVPLVNVERWMELRNPGTRERS